MNKKRLLLLGASFAVFLLAVIGFAELADEVHDGDTLAIDQAILRAINTTAAPGWDTFYLGITQLGGVVGIISLTLIGLTILLVKRHRKWATILAVSVAGAAIINLVLKFIFERSRPDLWQQLVTETSYSFPSGHAMLSSVFAFAVIAICWHTRYRVVATIVALSFMVLVSFSRLYLGVHYPTDVAAGWIVSALWICIVLVSVNGLQYYRARASRRTT